MFTSTCVAETPEQPVGASDNYNGYKSGTGNRTHGIQQLVIVLNERLLLGFIELARNNLRLVIFEPKAMQQRDQPDRLS
jgi:hypothetical protein